MSTYPAHTVSLASGHLCSLRSQTSTHTLFTILPALSTHHDHPRTTAHAQKPTHNNPRTTITYALQSPTHYNHLRITIAHASLSQWSALPNRNHKPSSLRWSNALHLEQAVRSRQRQLQDRHHPEHRGTQQMPRRSQCPLRSPTAPDQRQRPASCDGL